jgi:hypothetical protein
MRGPCARDKEKVEKGGVARLSASQPKSRPANLFALRLAGLLV